MKCSVWIKFYSGDVFSVHTEPWASSCSLFALHSDQLREAWFHVAPLPAHTSQASFFFPEGRGTQRQTESSDSSSLCCWRRKARTTSCGWIFTKRRCEVFPSAPGVCSSRVNREEAAVWPWRDSNWESWAPNRLLFFSLVLWFIIYPWKFIASYSDWRQLLQLQQPNPVHFPDDLKKISVFSLFKWYFNVCLTLLCQVPWKYVWFVCNVKMSTGPQSKQNTSVIN